MKFLIGYSMEKSEHFSRRQKSRPSPQEHGGRGVWGEFRRVLAKNRGQPRRLACQSNAPQKNTLVIKRSKNRARAKRKEQRVFFCGAANVSERRRVGFIRRGFPEKALGFRSGCVSTLYVAIFPPPPMFRKAKCGGVKGGNPPSPEPEAKPRRPAR